MRRQTRQRGAGAERRRRVAVAEAFGSSALIEESVAGETIVWRAGDLVFKPAPDGPEWAWLGRHLPTIREHGFRLALPVPAPDGRWVVEGMCAQTWLAGSHPERPRWPEVLEVCERFHAACRHLPRPPFLDDRTHPWAVGDRVAWGEQPSPVSHPLLDRLVASRRPLDLPPQVIHGDMTENVLFAEDLPPGVIDPSPYWRPAGLAAAIVVADAISWSDADARTLLGATAHIEGFGQLLVRAVIFRLVTGSVLREVREDEADAAGFQRAADVALELAG
jgi:uncharacterized protein (TIGR02569 family)